MNNRQTDTSPENAHRLMSALLDGELEAADAQRLERYLAKNPQEIDWMESQSILRESLASDASLTNNDEAIAAILDQLPPKEAAPKSKLLKFTKFFAPLAAAAAIVLVTTIAWRSHTASSANVTTTVGSDVEYVSTDIPNANPIVFTDEESGWTVVWVATMDPIPEGA